MATAIEWTHRPGTIGETWNPVTGCSAVSEGCEHCYARRMAHRLAGRCGYPEAPHEFDVTLHGDRLEQPLHWKKPRTVFVVSMGDLFHKEVPFEYIAHVWANMYIAKKHAFIVLTKRPKRMLEFLSDCGNWEGWITHDGTPPKGYGGTGIVVGNSDNWPLRNVWLGVTAENQRTADERIPILLEIPAPVHFVSVEPMLGPVNIAKWLGYYYRTQPDGGYDAGGLDWVIAGGESGPGARPMHPDWVRGLRDQCQEAAVPFFFKQWGAWLPYRYLGIGYFIPLDGCYTINGSAWPRGRVTAGSDLGQAWRETRGSRVVGARRIGKKHTGRRLDGREWNEWPRPEGSGE